MSKRDIPVWLMAGALVVVLGYYAKTTTDVLETAVGWMDASIQKERATRMQSALISALCRAGELKGKLCVGVTPLKLPDETGE